MFKSSFHLFTLFGIPVKADLSLVVLLLIILTQFSNAPVAGLLYGLMLLFSIVFHEFAHSLVAMAFGGKVRDITLLMFGGQASITRLPSKPWQELLLTAAGPASSFFLAAVGSILLLYAGLESPLEAFAKSLLRLNLILGVFNLIPAFPMDGGRIFRTALEIAGFSKLKATWVASRLGKGIAVFWVVMSILSFMRQRPLPLPAWLPEWADLLWDLTVNSNLFLLFIAFMIYQAAEAEYQMVRATSFGRWSNTRDPQGCSPLFKLFRLGGNRGEKKDDGVREAVISPPPYEKDGKKHVVPLDDESRFDRR